MYATHKPTIRDLRRMIRELPTLRLSPEEHQIGEIPHEVKIKFLDAKFMPLFEPFAGLNDRTLKLVNYNQAAINISFFKKHKYKLNKEPDREEIHGQLLKKMEELKAGYGQAELFAVVGSGETRDEQRRQLIELQEILNDFQDYRFAVSNYFRNYTYWYVTWRWENTDGTRGHGNDHLLKDETDYESNTTILKQNVMFVDMDRIVEHTPYVSKKVETFLSGFEKRIDIGTKDVFVTVRGGGEESS